MWFIFSLSYFCNLSTHLASFIVYRLLVLLHIYWLLHFYIIFMHFYLLENMTQTRTCVQLPTYSVQVGNVRVKRRTLLSVNKGTRLEKSCAWMKNILTAVTSTVGHKRLAQSVPFQQFNSSPSEAPPAKQSFQSYLDDTWTPSSSSSSSSCRGGWGCYLCVTWPLATYDAFLVLEMVFQSDFRLLSSIYSY